MPRIVNLEILGHPVNVAIIVLMIVLFWFGIYALRQSGILPPDTDDKK